MEAPMSLYRWYIKKREKLVIYFFNNDIFVAIARLDDYEAARRILLGFADTVARKHRKSHEFRSITAYGDTDELRRQLTKAFVDPYTMILSIGAETTLIAKSISTELSSNKPVGFVDIRDPQRLGIIKSHTHPDNNFFGLVDKVDRVDDHVYRLLRMIPRLEHVFLVYDPLQELGYSELEKNRFLIALGKKSVEVTTIPASSHEALTYSIEERVRRIYQKYQYNAIMTLRDPLIMSAMTPLSYVAEKYQVPLYSADPESILKFAAIGSGHNGYEMGGNVAVKSLPLIQQRERPLLIPTIFHNIDYKSYANRSIMALQGGKITAENYEWFKNHVVYTPF